MRMLTCNIRCYGANDGENNWVHRKDFCAEVIASRSPQIICFQEMWGEQFADLKAALPGFETFGMVDEPLGRHPMNAIFYQTDAFDRISAGGYWLSETPHVTGSSSWESRCVRLANWLRLTERGSGKEFRVMNTHLDHVSQAARENQARVINEDAQAYPEAYPQLLTGDLNCDARNPAIQVFKDAGWQDTYGAVHGTEDPGHTYHRFLGPDFAGETGTGKMDWVFFRGKVRVNDAEVICDARAGRFPSDHYFVSADVVF